MARFADCRKCVHFVPYEQLDDETREQALVWVEKFRPGERLLGWCNAYNRPVTYYVGSCYRFMPKPTPKAKRITEYLRGGPGV